MRILTILAFSYLFLSLVEALQATSSVRYATSSSGKYKGTRKQVLKINFKKKGAEGGDNGGDGGSGGDEGSWWRKISRFLPGVQRSKLEKSFETPVPEIGDRYMVRLVNPQIKNRRHIITRLIRFLPDLKYESAGEIVDLALDNGVSLIRVFNSLKDTEFLCDMLRKADPPIRVEVYDNKKGELINL